MPTTPNYAADMIPRLNPAHVRVATFNVENLFSRAIVMNFDDNKKGQPYLDDYRELNTLFAKPTYSAADKARILKLMAKYKLTATRPQNKYLEFRKIRGRLFAKVGGKMTVVATGRKDWVGWIELKEEQINDAAIHNTARVIAAVDADICVLCEVEHRPALLDFHDGVLVPILQKTGRLGYPYIMLIDGNDKRGIDVAILSRFPIPDITSHVFDIPGSPPIFARDCAEYLLEVPNVNARFIMLVNHFSSKGSDPTGMQRRIHQATQVASIVNQRMSQGFTHFMVAGDLNDTPGSAGLQPVIQHPKLTDAVKQFAVSIDPTGKRLGTYETGKEQFDYLLMSPAVVAAAKQAGIERRGHFAPRTWKAFDTVTSERMEASDHHAVWVDLSL